MQTEGAHHCHQGNPLLSSHGGLVDAHGPSGSRLSQPRLPAHTQMAMVTSAPPRAQAAQLTAVAQSPGHASPRTGPRQVVSGPQRRLLPPAEAFAPLICTCSLGMPCHPTIIPCLEAPLTFPRLLPFSSRHLLWPSVPFTLTSVSNGELLT